MEESYIVSARKYRPSTFSSVVGQKALTATLRNAIQTNRLAHAYLFCGSRGVGKTTCARIFAKTINCANPTPQGDPCNECPSCKAFNENRSLNIIELDAASNNSVDDIRALTDQVQIPPVDGKYRVFIVDEVHMLSQAAFNAFLKTLEEPPAHAIFILATTEKHKIIPTILSRCQIYDFKRITINDIIDHLAYVASCENITAERPALTVIARKADGAMRDALSIFDQVAASSRGNITYESTIENLNILDQRYYGKLVEAFRAGDVPTALLIYKEIRDRGFDTYFFLSGLAGYLRDLMAASNPQTQALLDTDNETLQQMAEQAKGLPPQFFYAAMSLCNDADMAYRTASSKTFLAELLLIKLCQLLSPSPTSDTAQTAGTGEGLKPIKPATPQAAQAAAPAPAAQPALAAQSAAAAPAPAAPADNLANLANLANVAPAAAQPAAAQPAVGAPAAAPTAISAAPAAAPAAPKRAAVHRGKSHVSLRDAFQNEGSQQAATSAAPAKALRATPFTDENLSNAWDSYIQANPKAHVLINTMRASRPFRKSADTPELEMTVANQPQVDVMTQEMPSLLNHLRNTLSNDHITINISVNEDPNAPSAWNDRELLRHLIETNPNVATLVKDLRLSIT